VFIFSRLSAGCPALLYCRYDWTLAVNYLDPFLPLSKLKHTDVPITNGIFAPFSISSSLHLLLSRTMFILVAMRLDAYPYVGRELCYLDLKHIVFSIPHLQEPVTYADAQPH
jgi:hypothetical protein